MSKFDKPGWLFFALAILGFTSILTQLAVIREFLNVFQGNELIIGSILFIWMLFSAAGSKAGQYLSGKKYINRSLAVLFYLTGIFPIIIITALYIIEVRFFDPGIHKSLTAAVILSVLLLAPFCLFSGMIFTILTGKISEIIHKNSISACYGWETLGSLMAGIIFSLGLAFVLGTYQVLAVIFGVTVALLLLLLSRRHIKISMLLIITSLVVVFVIFSGFPDRRIRSMLFREKNIIYFRDTPYGNVCIANTNGQYEIYENGTLYFSSQDNQYHEETVHYAMLQHQKPKRVIIISGGMEGMIRQALKYPSVERIDYFELNPWMLRAEKMVSSSITDPRVRLHTTDARKWISHAGKQYDVIILNAPDPSNAQLNRYFTRQFFKECKKALNTGGVMEFNLTSTVNYMNNESARINSIMYHTARDAFKNVAIIPGSRNFFVASDMPLSVEIGRLAEKSGIQNDFVNRYFIDDQVYTEYNRNIMSRIVKMDPVTNNDFEPYAYFAQIMHWISKYEGKKTISYFLIPGMVMLTLIFLLNLKGISPVSSALFTGSFAGASAEFLILMIFQIVFGYIYQMTGLIVGFYMAGLTLGSIMKSITGKFNLKRLYIVIQLMMALTFLILPVFAVFAVRNQSHGFLIHFLILLTTIFVSFAAGLEFNIASQLEKQTVKTASMLYAVDLTGAASGTLITSIICFPLLGLFNTCYIIAALIVGSVLLLALRNRHLNR